MKKTIKTLFHFLLKRKIFLAVILVLIAAAGYFGWKTFGKSESNILYVLAEVKKGTIIKSVSGSGQVSVSSQVDIKAKESGDILAVNAQEGQEVKAGTVLIQLDAKDAYKTVRDAEANLASAKLSLEKLNQPATEYSVMQAENAITSARNSLEKLKITQETDYQKALQDKEKAADSITKSYEDSFNTISDVFLDLPTIITKTYDILYSYEIGKSEIIVGGGENNSDALINNTNIDDRDELKVFLSTAQSDYKTARSEYDANFDDYKNASRYSDTATIESLFNETLETAKAVAQTVKSESNLLDAWADRRTKRNLTVFSKVKEYQTSLATYIGQTNNHLSSLLSIQRTLEDNRETLADSEQSIKEMERNNPLDIAAAEASIKEKEASLKNLRAGADSLDIRAQELSIKQKENALSDAREKLANYTVRAPFDGVIAEVNVKKGDTLSASTAAITFITKQRIAEISLNEVDATKVKVGQKATLTFDAIDNFNITGEVGEIDALGTVSQGVVTYNVKIVFDTQDERVKPGMSVSASIVTDVKQDVLLVSNSAIKSSGEISYVEMPNEEIAAETGTTSGSRVSLKNSPRQQIVQIGLANDSDSEITEGLKEGDQVITQTINPSATQSQSSTSGQSLFQIPGSSRGNFR